MKADHLRRLVRQHLLKELQEHGQNRITALFFEEVERVYSEILNANRHLDQQLDQRQEWNPAPRAFSGGTSY